MKIIKTIVQEAAIIILMGVVIALLIAATVHWAWPTSWDYYETKSGAEQTYYMGPYDLSVSVSRNGSDGKFHNVPEYCLKFPAFDRTTHIETFAVVKFKHIYRDKQQNISVSAKLILKDRTSQIEQDIIKEGENIISRKDHYSIIPLLGCISVPAGLYKIKLLVSSGASNLPENTVTAKMLGNHTVVRISTHWQE